MQILLAVIVVAMFFWYTPTSGDTAAVIAEVNGTRIMETEFSPRYRTALQYMQATQPTFNDEDEKKLQLDVTDALVKEEVLRQYAVRLGLHASPSEVASTIENDPRFARQVTSEDGRLEMVFEEDRFERYKTRMGRSAKAVDAEFETAVLLKKLQWIVMLGMNISEDQLRADYIREERRVNVRYLRVDPNEIKDSMALIDTEVDAWMAENTEAIKEKYDKDFKRSYDLPERVTLGLIRLELVDGGGPGTAEADIVKIVSDIRVELEAGADFAALARKWSEDSTALKGGDMGERRLPTLSSAVRDAIVDLEVGKVSELVKTERDVSLYVLNKRTPARVIPLEEVNRELAEGLIRTERASDVAKDYADRLHAEWSASGEVPGVLLLEHTLDIKSTGPVNASSRQVGGPPPELIAAALKAEKGDVLSEVFVDDSRPDLQPRFVAQVQDLQAANMEIFESRKGEDLEMRLLSERYRLWDRWTADQVAKASVKIAAR